MKLWKVISGCVLKAGYGRKSKLVIVKGCIWPLKVKLGVHWWRGEISTGLGELPMGRWLPYSTCQSCTWQRECQDGAAHCSHSWVTPWPWIYIFPVHWENTQTHKSCHKWRQRRKVAPEVQVELLSSKLCTPDKGFQKSNLNLMTQQPNCSDEAVSGAHRFGPSCAVKKVLFGFWNTSRHLNQGKERDTIERHWSHATEPSSGSETTSCSGPCGRRWTRRGRLEMVALPDSSCWPP